MLIGSNSMDLNGATMALIVQYYFDNKLFNKDEHKPKVKGVRAEAINSVPVFTVDLENPSE